MREVTMRSRSFNLIVGTDASPPARAALAATMAFPWPDRTRAQGLMVAGVPGLNRWRRRARTALLSWLRGEAVRVRRTLRTRWPDAEVAVVGPPVVPAIVKRARRERARVIVVGSRDRGTVRTALLGSVSRDLVQQAHCPVLVVKGAVRRPRRFLIGLDGSIRSRRAVRFVGNLEPGADGRITLLAVVEPRSATSMFLLPASVRRVVAAELAALNRERLEIARRELANAARRLTRAGWHVESVVRRGAPLPELLKSASTKRADVIVVGARGTGGLERLLLGSVAAGTLAHARVPVLIVK
jgi:nucleotide-binding universal stress UspA family protein